MSRGKRGRRARAWLACGVSLLAGVASAQETREERTEVRPPDGAREHSDKRYDQPVAPAPGPTIAVAPATLAAPAPSAPAAEAGPWKAARWLALDGQEARVALADGEARVQVGALIGGDRVKSVRERQLVLSRPARPDQPGGDALVIVDFADGGTRVRVLLSRDPKATTPAEPQ